MSPEALLRLLGAACESFLLLLLFMLLIHANPSEE